MTQPVATTALLWWPQRLVPIVNTKIWEGPMMWPTGMWFCPTGASHWLMEKPCGQKEVALGLKVDTKTRGEPMTWPSGYYSLSVVAAGMQFGPIDTHHHHKDLGRSHDVANGYRGPSMVATCPWLTSTIQEVRCHVGKQWGGEGNF